MGEVTDKGYLLKTQNEWFAEEEQLYLDIDSEWNLDPSSPDGLKIASDSENFANLDEVAQRAYNSKDPAKAAGYDLRVLCAITGTIPGDGTPSTVELTASGSDGALIPSGSQVQNVVNDSVWVITSDATIAGGTATVQAQSQESGAIEASAGDISKIITPITGWTSVTNAIAAQVGMNPDSDAELRRKRTAGVALPGNNQVDNMFAAIANVDDVTRVTIYENEENTLVIEGTITLPPHSLTVLVAGGTDESVAEAIYLKKNPGVLLHQEGTPVSVSVTSEVTGNVKNIRFGRPVAKNILVDIDVKDDGTLPSSPQIEEEITQAIIDYVNGDLDLGDGFNQIGFRIGEDVPASRIFTPVNYVIGNYGNSYILSLTVDGVALSAVDSDGLAVFLDSNINVTITP